MKNIYLATLIFLLGLSSCSKDFLERFPDDQISSSQFLISQKDLEFAVNGVYNSLGFPDWAANYNGGSTTYYLDTESCTDNSLEFHKNNVAYSLGLGTATSQEWYPEGMWSQAFKGIQRVNRIMEGAPNINDIKEDYKKRLLAEARFLRAHFYFNLAYLFGDVPYLTRSITPAESKGMERTPQGAVLDSIVAELTLAANDLPTSYPAEETGKATKGTALALKARVLLYAKKWTEAAAAAKEVMDLNVYSLYPSYENLFTYESINCSEVIFDIQEMPEKQWNFLTQHWGAHSLNNAWSGGAPLQSLVDAYQCNDGLSIDDSPTYDPTHPYDNRDPRLNFSILTTGSPWLTGVYNTIPVPESVYSADGMPGDASGTNGYNWDATQTGYNVRKYVQPEDVENTMIYGWMMSGSCHVILIRYAEVLLTYAEAKIEANDIDQSVFDAINLVRNGRADVKMPDVDQNMSQTELREWLRNERRVELAMEGLRLMDIRRWGIAKDVMNGPVKAMHYRNGLPTDDPTAPVIYKIADRIFKDKDYLWPIPQSEIDVSGIEQNPGW